MCIGLMLLIRGSTISSGTMIHFNYYRKSFEGYLKDISEGRYSTLLNVSWFGSTAVTSVILEMESNENVKYNINNATI